MAPYLTRWFGNPSSHHEVGEAAASALDDARARVAAVLGMRAGDIVFTSGGTESNNTAIKGLMLGSGRKHLVTTAIEHESVLASADYLARLHGVEVTYAPVDATGTLTPETLAAALRDDTALVSVGYANNEVGTVQDAAALAAVAKDRGVPLHLDAVQAAGWLPLAELGADALTVAGHKIGAPKGTGILAVRGRLPLEPLLHGGGQERGRRSGTPDVAGAVAIATALSLAEAERAADAARVAALRDAFIVHVLHGLPGARLTGHPTRRLPGTASFVFPGVNGETVLLELERRGIVSSSGSACAAGSDEASHVLLALGLSADDARTAVRFTFPHGLTQSLDTVASAVVEAVTTAQSLDTWRAVLVDDASADATRRLFADAAASDPRFRLVEHREPRGLGAARNSGLDLVDTEFTAFLDADDRLRPDALARLSSTLEHTGSDFVVGAYVRLRPDADGPGYTPGDVQPWVAAATDPARRRTTLTEHPAASGNIVAWSKLSRTSFWHAHGLRFPEGRYYEDQVLAQRMYTLTTAFDVIPDVVVDWRERRDRSSITQRLSEIDVLTDYLEALGEGIAVLRAAGADAAVAERGRLIRTLDLPPLERIADTHPDLAYRIALEAFLETLPM
ncbi:hypothetical protein LUZ63_021070 [Rhynchospora breviuscula]|uniref:Cysteine desulfurase n=1 Tax=Rhynchospora breviuscula TaxID=2022672 RepID=A0A9P9Z897_9POAL|nr:hypothetical protein LUZ63_021070 [Rhynchospora breviuscula]